jgi:hypothetical protein
MTTTQEPAALRASILKAWAAANPNPRPWRSMDTEATALDAALAHRLERQREGDRMTPSPPPGPGLPGSSHSQGPDMEGKRDKKPPGRPRYPEGTARTLTLTLRVSAEERAEMHRRAEDEGITLSGLLRRGAGLGP